MRLSECASAILAIELVLHLSVGWQCRLQAIKWVPWLSRSKYFPRSGLPGGPGAFYHYFGFLLSSTSFIPMVLACSSPASMKKNLFLEERTEGSVNLDISKCGLSGTLVVIST